MQNETTTPVSNKQSKALKTSLFFATLIVADLLPATILLQASDSLAQSSLLTTTFGFLVGHQAVKAAEDIMANVLYNALPGGLNMGTDMYDLQRNLLFESANKMSTHSSTKLDINGSNMLNRSIAVASTGFANFMKKYNGGMAHYVANHKTAA